MIKKLKSGLIWGMALLALFYMISPSYPEVSAEQSDNAIKAQIKSILKKQAKNLQWEAMADNRRVTVEAEKAYKAIGKDLDKCNNDKECLVEVYEEYMDEWSTSGLKKQARAQWMVDRFGLIGQEINRNFGAIY